MDTTKSYLTFIGASTYRRVSVTDLAALCLPRIKSCDWVQQLSLIYKHFVSNLNKISVTKRKTLKLLDSFWCFFRVCLIRSREW